MKIPPKDFFKLVEAGAFNQDLQIAVGGKWCGIVPIEVYPVTSRDQYYTSFSMRGLLIPDSDFTKPQGGRTVARIGSHNIPCEIFSVEVEYANFCEHIRVGISFQYSMYTSHCGDFTQSEGEIPEGIKHMIEIEKNPRKKTVFDILDLD